MEPYLSPAPEQLEPRAGGRSPEAGRPRRKSPSQDGGLSPPSPLRFGRLFGPAPAAVLASPPRLSYSASSSTNDSKDLLPHCCVSMCSGRVSSDCPYALEEVEPFRICFVLEHVRRVFLFVCRRERQSIAEPDRLEWNRIRADSVRQQFSHASFDSDSRAASRQGTVQQNQQVPAPPSLDQFRVLCVLELPFDLRSSLDSQGGIGLPLTSASWCIFFAPQPLGHTVVGVDACHLAPYSRVGPGPS